MALVRVFLFTYKRNQLLKRAIQSLLDQTFKDWVCELHNDCPEDSFPEDYVKALNDPRFEIKKHEKNLGTTASFNLAFGRFNEKFGSMLEDDNWWEPDFLKVLTDKMNANDNVHIMWSNMRLWKELPDNEWLDLKKNIWDVEEDTWFEKGHINQAVGAVHSTGAMLYRSEFCSEYIIPENSLSDAVELIRERAFRFPLYLVAKPLANFSQTISTSRSKKNWEWTATQVMMLSSFILANNQPHEKFKELLSHFKRINNRNSLIFILSNLYFIKDKRNYSLFNVSDWINFLKWSIRYMPDFRGYVTRNINVYNFLLDCTQKNTDQPKL